MIEEFHPRKTRLLVGHEKQLNIVKSAINNSKLHHSWIFEGPNGVGKATFAYLIANILLSSRKDNNKINNQIYNNVHPDLKIIEDDSIVSKQGATSNIIPVSKVREIEDFFSKKASYAGWRVAIIDSLDKLNIYGLNALLKILEEPPKKSLILAIANRNSNTIPTLKSRCNILRFSLLEKSDCEKILTNLIADLNIEIMNKLLILSEGSPGKAISIYENKGIEIYEKISELFLNLPNISMTSIENIHKLIISKSGNEALNILRVLFTVFISRTYRRHFNIINDDINKYEKDAQLNCIDKMSMSNLSTLWENICDNINQTILFNLDKKQAVLEMVNELIKILKYKENYVLNINGK